MSQIHDGNLQQIEHGASADAAAEQDNMDSYDDQRWPRFLRPFTRDFNKVSTASPIRLMLSTLLLNKTALILGAFLMACDYTARVLLPELLGAGVDAHLAEGFTPHLWLVIGGLLGCGVLIVLGSGLSQLTFIANWLSVFIPVTRLVARKGARDGVAVNREIGAGDAVTVTASDTGTLAMVNSTLSAVFATITAIVIGVLLIMKSTILGLITVIVLPVIALTVTLVVKPAAQRQDAQRGKSSALTAATTDAVSGLRILRGIGGEKIFIDHYHEKSQEVCTEGYRVATYRGVLTAIQMGLPGLFMVAAIWVGVAQVDAGKMQVGDLVTAYGLILTLEVLLQQVISVFWQGSRAWVAAKRARRMLLVPPRFDDRAVDPVHPARPRMDRARLIDAASGLVLEPGKITALVARDPIVTEAIAKRLARIEDAPEGVRVAVTDPGDPTCGEPANGGVEITEIPLAYLREHVILQAAQAQLFSGTLRQNVDCDRTLRPRPINYRRLIATEKAAGTTGSAEQVALLRAERYEGGTAAAGSATGAAQDGDRPGDDALRAALEVADCHDVLDSLGDDLGALITERGRSLSGGQRQRVALARAIATDADVLVLIEPTSAVDSHTENRIAQRLQAARAGRTTVIVTTSPIMLEHVDTVAFVRAGRVQVQAPHRELMAATEDAQAAAYRALIRRETAPLAEGEL